MTDCCYFWLWGGESGRGPCCSSAIIENLQVLLCFSACRCTNELILLRWSTPQKCRPFHSVFRALRSIMLMVDWLILILSDASTYWNGFLLLEWGTCNQPSLVLLSNEYLLAYTQQSAKHGSTLITKFKNHHLISIMLLYYGLYLSLVGRFSYLGPVAHKVFFVFIFSAMSHFDWPITFFWKHWALLKIEV